MGSLVGPIVVKLVDERLAKRRQSVAQADADLAHILTNVEAVLVDCTQFWGSAASDLTGQSGRLVASIQARLHNINSLLNELFRDHPDLLALARAEWKELHRAATGGPFEDDDREADSSRLTVILTTGWALRQATMRLRRQLPPPKMVG